MRIAEKDRCKICQGKKTVKETKILEVHIDKGMQEGQKVFFRGEGDQEVRKLIVFLCFQYISSLMYYFQDKLYW